MKYQHLLAQTPEEKSAIIKQFARFKRTNKKVVDNLFLVQHDKVFKKIDCLSCGNCCKTTSPIFRDVDVKRIAKKLKMGDKSFTETYLKKDSDGDLVLLTSPCAFLADDNSCSIYDDRPLACREYPHTNRKHMYQVLPLALENTLICPAVAEIVRNLEEKTKPQ